MAEKWQMGDKNAKVYYINLFYSFTFLPFYFYSYFSSSNSTYSPSSLAKILRLA